jgi:7-cyano-7-deazaguanine reductase
MTDRNYDQLDKLGSSSTDYPDSYSPDLLEVIERPKTQTMDQWVSFICTEFTSLCPKTAQPDFAKIFIHYIPDRKIVESKSLKLYLFSFRNHGDFHEHCVQMICDELAERMQPKYLEVIGEFTPRGGISIFPYSQFSNSEKKYQEIYRQRQLNYSPGKYSFSLGRPY